MKDKRKNTERGWVGKVVLVSLLLMVLDVVFLGVLFAAKPELEKAWVMQVGEAVAVGCFVVLVASLVYRFFSIIGKGLGFVFSKPAYLPIPIVVFAVLIVGGWTLYGKYNRSKLVGSLPVLQASLTEVAAAKLAGDMLDDKTKSPPAGVGWQDVKNTAAAEAGILANLSTGATLDRYSKTATVWAARIRDESKDHKAWQTLPKEPGDFEIRLKPKDAEGLFRSAVTEIGSLKSLGDAAIFNKDKDAKRFIAARLLVQKHWVDGLAHYQEAGLLARLTIPALAYAVEGKNVCFTAWNGKPLCTLEVQGSLTGIYEAAKGLAGGVKDADIKWKDAWYGATDVVAQSLAANGHELEAQAEVQIGTDAVSVNSARVQEFIDRCRVVAGTIGGANQIVDRMFTTERGTYCGFKQNQNNCWRYQTASGDYYSGGDVGCLVEIIPLSLQVFMDDCYAYAGTIGGANQIIDRLPTSERGTYCGFKKDKDNCWRYRTASGGYYAGGDDGCIEINLLPQTIDIRVPVPGRPEPEQPKVAEPTAPAVKPKTPVKTQTKPVVTPKPTPSPTPSPAPTPAPPPSPAPAPSPEPEPTPISNSWKGKYQVTSWSGTCSDEQGRSWATGSPYGTWEVESNGQMCGMCGCATVSPDGNYYLDCDYKQAWGTNYWKLSATFRSSGGSVTVNGTLMDKSHRVIAEYSTQIEPGTTKICNSTFSLSRYSK